MAIPSTVGFRDSYEYPSGNAKPAGIKSVYDAAATQQAGDYDNIMGNYDSIFNNASNASRSPAFNYSAINPVFNRQLQTTPYQRSSELGTALSGLSEFSRTGGYSDADVNNIRERGISPIRSIYDSAKRNMDRQKVLQGGYSPNYGAVNAKMARDASSQIGGLTTKVNADIAQMVASGRLSGLNSLGSVASRDNEMSNQFNQRNTDINNQVELANTEEQRRVDNINNQGRLDVERLNNQNKQQNTNTQLQATQGKQSLYGTTPALTNMFGNQVLQNNAQQMQAVTTANAIKNQRANIGLNLVQDQLNPFGAR